MWLWFFTPLSFLPQVEQNWATLQGGEMTIQTTQASEATQAVASLAEAAVAASQEMQQGATVTMALNRWRPGWGHNWRWRVCPHTWVVEKCYTSVITVGSLMLLAHRILLVGLFIIISLHPPHATPNNQANFSDLQLKPAGQGTWVPLALSHFVPVNRPKAARFEYFGFFFFKGLEDLITNKKLQDWFSFYSPKETAFG